MSLGVKHEDEVDVNLLFTICAVPTKRDGQGQQAIDYAKDKEMMLKLLLQPPIVGIRPDASQTTEQDEPAPWPLGTCDAGFK